MKITAAQLYLVILISLFIGVGITFFSISLTNRVLIKKDIDFENHPVIIWNDVLESIPLDNSEIVLEATINDTIYIGPKY